MKEKDRAAERDYIIKYSSNIWTSWKNMASVIDCSRKKVEHPFTQPTYIEFPPFRTVNEAFQVL